MKHLLMFRRTSGLIFIMLLLTGLYACGEDEEQYTPPGLGVPVPVFELKREVYADPGIFDQPRVQFVWQGPERNREEIWSVKIDGTDLRLAADEELLYSDETHDMRFVRTPVRSPDNRYILAQYFKLGRNYEIYLIDLKTKTKKRIMECRIWTAPWVGDSQSFFCAIYSELKRYYVESGKTEVIRQTNNGFIYVQQNSEQIFKMEEDGFTVWDFKGNELRKENLGTISRTLHNISSGGQKIIHTKGLQAFISNTKQPFKTTEILFGNNLMALEYPENILNGNIVAIEKININPKLRTDIYSKFGGAKFNYEKGMQLGKFTLFNERINNGMQESRWNGSKKAD